jgi:hypothetical protein
MTARRNPSPPNAGHGAGAPCNGAVQPCQQAPAQPPTAAEMQNNPVVRNAMAQAWQDSQPNDAANRHEEGGWIYMDTTTGAISVRRQNAGQRAGLDLSQPPATPGSVVVGKFHTHPNPTAEGWEPGPSGQDRTVDAAHGVPDLIQADDGSHVSGPDSRRGGLGGGPGFPP